MTKGLARGKHEVAMQMVGLLLHHNARFKLSTVPNNLETRRNNKRAATNNEQTTTKVNQRNQKRETPNKREGEDLLNSVPTPQIKKPERRERTNKNGS